MFSLIVKVRRKPERVRRQIAFLVAATCTGVIVLLWLVTIGASVREPADSSVLRRTEKVEKSPLNVFSDTVGAFINDTETAVRELRDGFSSVEETRLPAQAGN